MNSGPFARVLVRYVAGMLIGGAGANALVNDPDVMHFVTMGVGALLAGATEVAYKLAIKRGWKR